MDKRYLEPTAIIDSDHKSIIKFAEQTIGKTTDPVDRAVRLYYAVRDGIWYNPYLPFYLPEHFQASIVLRKGEGYCISKASLLCALGRACGIPSRVGFADVRNHLATDELIQYIGSSLFVYHGFTEFHLKGKWVKATPAFNAELCKKHHVAPLEFNGYEDSIFQPYSLKKKQFMEYVADHGTFADIPVENIVAAWKRAYGKTRVKKWIEEFEKSGGKSHADFMVEQVWKGEMDQR